jgi:hypothetical protein
MEVRKGESNNEEEGKRGGGGGKMGELSVTGIITKFVLNIISK